MQLCERYFSGHGSFGLDEDDVAICSIAKVLISVVKRGLSPFICQNGVCTSLHQVFHDQVMPIGCRNMKRSVTLLVCLLIYVLALTENDADKIKFTIVAGLPNV